MCKGSATFWLNTNKRTLACVQSTMVLSNKLHKIELKKKYYKTFILSFKISRQFKKDQKYFAPRKKTPQEPIESTRCKMSIVSIATWKLTFKFVICVNAFPQSPHTYGRNWEWIRSWLRRLAACVNAVNQNIDISKVKFTVTVAAMAIKKTIKNESQKYRFTFLTGRTLVFSFSRVISNMC